MKRRSNLRKALITEFAEAVYEATGCPLSEIELNSGTEEAGLDASGSCIRQKVRGH